MSAAIGISAVAAGIVLCAMIAPIVLLRAAVWSSRADGAENSSQANRTLAVELFSQDTGRVNQDVRVYGSYAELSNTVTVLVRQAQQAGDRRLALSLLREAQVKRSLAAGLRQSLRTTGLHTAETGPSFAYRAALRGELGRDTELQRAQKSKDRRDGDRAKSASGQLTAVAVAWTAGLVLFTFAQIAKNGSRQRGIFAWSGAAIALAAAVCTGLAWS